MTVIAAELSHLLHAVLYIIGKILGFAVSRNVFRFDALKAHMIFGGEGIRNARFSKANGAKIMSEGQFMKLCFNSCRRQFIASARTRIQHILDENSVSRGGIVYHNVCHRSHELAVL